MPAEVEGATFQASIGALQRMTQIPGEHFDQESTEVQINVLLIINFVQVFIPFYCYSLIVNFKQG